MAGGGSQARWGGVMLPGSKLLGTRWLGQNSKDDWAEMEISEWPEEISGYCGRVLGTSRVRRESRRETGR